MGRQKMIGVVFLEADRSDERVLDWVYRFESRLMSREKVVLQAVLDWLVEDRVVHIVQTGDMIATR